ncbi:MAG: nitrite reductase small subunit NirD [Gammaproteobacteria bacterium]|nr:nitrite reductase small subunit NirD [Gammaproteobacteria bacterium]MBU1555123.1 nitrite reductase small subunit NirD [Gammaproteobacteria bacterium]MBU2069178.1 nitrite reductase small subunit NirD [Gammaproteobacteria bacterium]MBU2184165.1 nitrite reductase small subunit NirD [Gammaproteobacteria bacterium]MBU2204955.1 nitrite reductase small subunit NirD [Gammaproteobacteria bacterium]
MSQLAYALDNQPCVQQQPVLLCQQQDLVPFSGVAARFGRHAIALFYLPGEEVELYGVSHIDPASGAPVMAHGLLGESKGEFYLAAPLHKQQYRLSDGQCLSDSTLKLQVFNVQLQHGQVWLLPPME